MRQKKRTAKIKYDGGGDKGNAHQEFLRLEPYQLVGNHSDSILYRLLKCGLRSAELSKQVHMLDFDDSTFSTSTDIDAVFIERLRRYATNEHDENDEYWQNIVKNILHEKVGMRFVENSKRYYLFPSCVFVTNDHVIQPTESSTRNTSRNSDTKDGDNSYQKTYKYQHDEDEANTILEERRRETATTQRQKIEVAFIGFHIQVKDGLSFSTLSSKQRGGDVVDNKTYYRYLKLEQTGLRSDDTLPSNTPLANTTNMEERCESAVNLIKAQIKQLFKKGSTNHVKVEIGDPSSTNSSHYNIKYDASKQFTEYNEKEKGFFNRKYFNQHRKDTNSAFDVDQIIEKHLNKNEIVQYLSERGDLTQEKRIILRYYNIQDSEERYIMYTFHVTNAASKLSGNAIHLVARSLQPNISDRDVQV